MANNMNAKTTSFEILSGANHDKELIDNTFWNYTPFQVEYMLDLMDRDMFESFVTHGHTILNGDKIRKAGPVNILWYEDGVLHGARLGKTELLGSVLTS